MTAQRKRQLFWTVLTAGYLLFIFCNSLQTAQVSGQRSLGVVAHINRLLENWSIPLAVTDHLVRKSAHFFAGWPGRCAMRRSSFLCPGAADR